MKCNPGCRADSGDYRNCHRPAASVVPPELFSGQCGACSGDLTFTREQANGDRIDCPCGGWIDLDQVRRHGGLAEHDADLPELECGTCGWDTDQDPTVEVRRLDGSATCPRCGSDMHEVAGHVDSAPIYRFGAFLIRCSCGRWVAGYDPDDAAARWLSHRDGADQPPILCGHGYVLDLCAEGCTESTGDQS
jgi:hypothetical protein